MLAMPDVDPGTATAARCYLGAALVVTGAAEEGADAGVGGARGGRAARQLPASPPSPCRCWPSLAPSRGDAEGERSFHERRLAVVSERGDVARLADTLNTLAEIALDDADAATARAYAAESVVIAGSALPLEARDATITLARAAAVDGDPETTAAHLRAALDAGRPDRTVACPGAVSAGRGCLAVLIGDPVTAVRAFASAQEVSRFASGTDEPIEADLAARLAEARAALEGRGFRREWRVGPNAPGSRPCAPRSKPWLHSRFPWRLTGRP